MGRRVGGGGLVWAWVMITGEGERGEVGKGREEGEGGEGQWVENQAVPRFGFFSFPRVLKTSVFRINKFQEKQYRKKDRQSDNERW